MIDDAPAGYDRIDEEALVGASFDAAREGLFTWALQRAAGIAVDAGRVVDGADVVLRARVGPLYLTAPCRVNAVVDEPRRAGFAYATRRGHPEHGQESFLLTRGADDAVTLTITGWSRPATWYARLGAPVTRLVQRRMPRAYLRALGPSRAYRESHE